MRLSLILPPVQPDCYPAIVICPHAGCGGTQFRHWQSVVKPQRDMILNEAVAYRSSCVQCGRTYCLHPHGVSHDQTSARLSGVALTCSVLGMSYAAVSTALGAVGWPLSKVAVMPRCRRRALRGRLPADGNRDAERNLSLHRSNLPGAIRL